MRNIEFILNQEEKIIIELEDSLDSILSCNEVPIWLGIKKDIHLLRNDFISESLYILILLLKKVLNNELRLHNSINEDIGLMWNKKLHGDKGLVYIKGGRRSFWIGEDYLLWTTPGNAKLQLTTWLYNDQDRNIILEITPDYPWHFDDPKPSEKFISYDDFMKNYKPLLIRTIPREVAKQWLIQAENLLKIVEENERRAKEEYYSSLAQKENK